VDSLIIATPVMTLGVPGKLKSFLDRFQVFFMAKYMRKDPLVKKEHAITRRSLVICLSGMNIPEVFIGVKMTLRAFLDIIDCPYYDELLISDMDTIRDIRTRPDLLESAYAKGFALGKLVKKN
jgi:hypothetical protein